MEKKQPPRAIEITSESDEEMNEESTPTLNQPNIKEKLSGDEEHTSAPQESTKRSSQPIKRSTRTSRTTTSREPEQAQNGFLRPQHNGYTSIPTPRSRSKNRKQLKRVRSKIKQTSNHKLQTLFRLLNPFYYLRILAQYYCTIYYVINQLYNLPQSSIKEGDVREAKLELWKLTSSQMRKLFGC